MKHALFVSFHYPPDASSSGVLRTLKYTRYLVDWGWRATVISPEINAYEMVDDGLTAQIPELVRVVRTSYRNTKQHFGIRGRYSALMALPDVWIGWLPWALAAGKQAAARDPVDVIYSTSPPATSHLIAWRLAAHLQKPWVKQFFFFFFWLTGSLRIAYALIPKYHKKCIKPRRADCLKPALLD